MLVLHLPSIAELTESELTTHLYCSVGHIQSVSGVSNIPSASRNNFMQYNKRIKLTTHCGTHYQYLDSALKSATPLRNLETSCSGLCTFQCMFCSTFPFRWRGGYAYVMVYQRASVVVRGGGRTSYYGYVTIS